MNKDIKIELWSASWCAPCKSIKREIDTLKRDSSLENGNLLRHHVSKLLPYLEIKDIEDFMEESASLGINSIPHWEVYMGGSRIQKGFKNIDEVVQLVCETN